MSLLTVCAGLVLTNCTGKPREAGLKVSYGTNGIQRLTYNGVVLEDLARYPSDAFHIWHMKAKDANGKFPADKQYSWGELNNGRTWNAATHTWLYSFKWGSISVQFVHKGDVLDMVVTEKNNADSGVTFSGATIYPFVLHFPELPSGFGDPSYQHLAVEANDPPPTADFGKGQVSVVTSDRSSVYRGFEPAGGGANYYPVISSAIMDSIGPGIAKVDRPINPGMTDSFTVSLNFAESEPRE